MQQNARETLLQKLESAEFKKTLYKAHLTESLSGGGIVKKIKRLLLTPEIYIPYLLIVRGRLYRKESVTARLFWGRTIDIPLQDYDSLALRAFGFAGGTDAELKLTRYFVKNLTPDDVFYDIGANYGFYSYLASELCKEVQAFEPIPQIADVVRRNIPAGANMSLNEVALSDTPGEVDLHISESFGLSTINASTTEIHSYTYDEAKKIRVKTQTLDGHVATHTKPTVLKIDVEGAEEQVILGGTRFLTENAPIVAMEIWGADNGGEISMRAVERLRGLGYVSYSIDSNGNLEKIEGDLSMVSSLTGGDNFIFKKL